MANRYSGHGIGKYYALRWSVLERDNFTCQYCGQSAPQAKLEVDHIIPVEEGGRDTMDNLKTACYSCNRGRSALKIISTRKQPHTPKSQIATQRTPRESARRNQLLEILNTKGEITPIELSQFLNTTTNNARVILTDSLKRGILKRKEKGLYVLSS